MGRKKWRQYQELLLKSVRQDSMETKDWEPAGRCNLCLEKEEDPDASTEPRPPSESASISSGCSVERDSSTPQASAGMTTLESVASSMAASLAAVAALTSVKPSGPQLYPPHLLPQWYLSQPQIPESESKSKSPMVMALPPSGPEQPLDLSKSSIAPSADKSPEPTESTSPLQHLVTPSAPSGCSQSLKVPSLNRQIFKAKPRISAVAGRRTYTEDELQAALRDIQSGKLGTRRAAVIYGIPRSTLRNKVYKLAMERERDSHLVLGGGQDLVGVTSDDLREDDDEERDLSGAEEEREVEKALMKPLLSMEDIIRISGEGANFPGTDSLRTLLQHGSKFLAEQKKEDGSSSPPIYPSTYTPNTDLWSGIEHSALGPYINQLFGGSLNNPNLFTSVPGSGSSPNERSSNDSPGDFLPKFPPPIELVRRMMAKDRLIQEEHQKKEQRQFQLNGSRPGDPGPSSSGTNHETSQDETSGSATPPGVILRIPSFKPTSKNGAPGESTGYPIAVKVGESSQHSVLSPPISGTRSESSSPPGMVGKGISVSLRDVIAKSISQKFQQPTEMHHIAHTPAGLEHFRRNEFPSPLGCNTPNQIIRNHNNNHLDDRKVQHSAVKPSPAGNTTSSAGGKGTRPKRGKYRNYDRDSLVEAVRAVQRGEMSVHRAGSYYGVPHSTLEYKVKERHLMRPRKREPKTTPEEIKRKDEGNIVRIPPGEKCKPLPPKPPKAPFTPPSPLPGPNGLKIPPMFDPSLSFSGGPPFPYWPPTPFHHLPMEYPRGPNFNPSPEQFFASQMIQRLQEDSTRSSQSPPPTLCKTARELAEKLYDGTGANGSFLDGIIRSSLETGLPMKNKEGENLSVDRMTNKALLDQLCINSRLTPLLKAGSTQEVNSSDDDVSKRAQYQNRSPTAHEPSTEIKAGPEEEKTARSPTNFETISDVICNEETQVKVEDIDESACDSKHTITRVDEAKVDEKEIRS